MIEPTIHILRTPGRYIGQRRQAYRHHWQTITRRYPTAEAALVAVARKAYKGDKRLRVLFVPNPPSYYEPHVVIEVTRK